MLDWTYKTCFNHIESEKFACIKKRYSVYNELYVKKIAQFLHFFYDKTLHKNIVSDKSYLFMNFIDFLDECCVIMKY